MTTEIKVPQLPESITDATLVAWHKKPGDAVKRDENLADLETDKVVLEVPAPANGVLREVKVQTGAVVTAGQLLALLEEGAQAAATAVAAKEAPPAEELRATGTDAGKEKLSPSVRRLIEENRLDAAAIPASGRDGRLTKSDVVDFLSRKPDTAPAASPTAVCRSDRLSASSPSADAYSASSAGKRARRASCDDDASASAHCAAPDRGAVHAGASHVFQRSRPHRGAGAARPLQGPVREGAWREARLHVLLRQGVHRGAEEIPGHQRLGRRQRHRLSRVLRYRRRRLHGARARRADRQGRGCQELRHHREGNRRSMRRRRGPAALRSKI